MAVLCQKSVKCYFKQTVALFPFHHFARHHFNATQKKSIWEKQYFFDEKLSMLSAWRELSIANCEAKIRTCLFVLTKQYKVLLIQQFAFVDVLGFYCSSNVQDGDAHLCILSKNICYAAGNKTTMEACAILGMFYY